MHPELNAWKMLNKKTANKSTLIQIGAIPSEQGQCPQCNKVA